MVFMKACLDMVATREEDHLMVLWTSRPGITRSSACSAIESTLVVSENIQLRWLFGNVDCTGELPNGFASLVHSAGTYAEASVQECSQLLHGRKPTNDSSTGASSPAQSSAEELVE
jgi:hypothetical protein